MPNLSTNPIHHPAPPALPGFDQFLWENPDFISLLAAGNDGEVMVGRES